MPFRPAGTPENSPPFQRWETMFGKAESPGGAKDVCASKTCDPENARSFEMAHQFSFVPDGTRFGFRSCYPPINRWAIVFRPAGTPENSPPFQRWDSFWFSLMLPTDKSVGYCLFVPQGHLKIAHRFNGGKQMFGKAESPGGAKEVCVSKTCDSETPVRLRWRISFLSSLTGLVLVFAHVTHR